MAIFVRGAGGHGVLFVEIPKGFIPIRTPIRLQVITEAAQGTSYDQMVGVSAAGRRHRRDAIRTSRRWCRASAAAPSSTLGGPNFGQLVVHLKPRSERKLSWSTRSSSELRPQARRRSRHAGVHAESADHPHRRPGHQEPVPVLDAVARQARAVRGGARSLEKELAELPGRART